eukprot:366470-Chlamydomonas_euryale.AAC.5
MDACPRCSRGSRTSGNASVRSVECGSTARAGAAVSAMGGGGNGGGIAARRAGSRASAPWRSADVAAGARAGIIARISGGANIGRCPLPPSIETYVGHGARGGGAHRHRDHCGCGCLTQGGRAKAGTVWSSRLQVVAGLHAQASLA